MSQEKPVTKKVSLERFELSNKPTLVITEKLRNKVDYLHSKVGSLEWSGELITREEKTINDLDDWKIIAEDIFLCDIGTSGFTGYEVGKGSFSGEDISDMYDQYPGLLEGTHKQQHIHSHHSMAAFFSGTDWEQMEDRASVSNYLLMLIVNFDGKWCAKVGFKGKKEGNKGLKLAFSNNTDDLAPLVLTGKEDNDVLVVMDCKIQHEGIQVDEIFSNRYEKVKKDKEEIEKKKKEELKKKYSQPAFEGKWKQGAIWEDGEEKDWKGYTQGWDDFEKVGGMWKKKQPKKISEMTEKEFLKFEEDEAALKVFQQDQCDIVSFELRHARCFLNSILDGTYSPYDYTDPMLKIVEQESGLLNAKDYEKYVEEFEDKLQEHFDVLFYGKNQNDYVDLIKKVEEYLIPYTKHSDLIGLMLESIQNELELYAEPVI